MTSESTRARQGASASLPDWLFLDCEWADTLASELLSLALVPADPALPEFYAERLILPENPTPFVASTVYPLLDRGRAAFSDLAIANSLGRCLASLRDPIICMTPSRAHLCPQPARTSTAGIGH